MNNNFRLISLLTIIFFCTPLVQAEEVMSLKDISWSVNQILNANKADQSMLSEMAYVSARGATLYKCMAICIEENGNKDDRDKKPASNLDQMSAKYYNVAAVFCAKTGKSDKNFLDQIKTLMEAYSNEMVKSKRLNNDYFGSPRLIKDQEALKKIQSLIFSLSDGIEASKNKK